MFRQICVVVDCPMEVEVRSQVVRVAHFGLVEDVGGELRFMILFCFIGPRFGIAARLVLVLSPLLGVRREEGIA